jgi:hypothetical protein
MLKGKEFGAAISRAIQLKIASGAAKTKAEIARHFKIQPPSLTDWVKKGSVSKDKLPELWRYFADVAGPEHWGMTADEWPLGLTGASEDHRIATPPYAIGQPAKPYCCEEPRPDLFVVPIFDVRASMGIGAPQPALETVIDNMRLTKEWVRSHLPAISSPSNMAVLSAFGDSMSPTLSDGDIMLVDRGVNDLKVDAVYVLALNDELYVKRIQRRITDGAIIIKSDNPLYDPVVVTNGEKAGLQVLGRVAWAWNGRKI